MKLLWQSLVLLLAVITVGESTYRLPDIKITKIEKTLKAHDNPENAVDETIICTSMIPENADTCVLVYKIGNETNTHAENPPVRDNCLQFPVSMSTFAGHTTEFILAFHQSVPNDTLLGEAEATLTIPGIHGDLKAAWVGERENKDGDKVRDLWMTGVTWSPCTIYVGENPKPYTCYCNEASCFAIGVSKSEDNASIFNCQVLDNELTSDDKVDVCTESTVPATINDKGPDISKIKLSYDDESITIAGKSSHGITAADVAVSWGDDCYVCDPFESIEGDCNIPSYISADREINILVVGKTDAAIESTLEKIQDYNLVGTAVSESTLEMRWTRDVKYKYYWATLFDETHTFTNTEVTCDEALLHCYAYFTGVSGDTHTVSIQPIDESDGHNIPTNEVVSKTVSMIQEPSIKALHISQVKLSWDSEGSMAEATVCLHHSSNVIVDADVQLLLVDAMGHWYRTHGLTQKEDGFLCFEEVTLDNHLFDLTRKVAVVVTQRDVNGLLVIASGQSDVFFPSVRVESISTHMACAFWSNPEDYNFIIRRTNQPVPVATSLTCSNCFCYLSKRVQMAEEERLVVEMETLGIRITAEVPLLLSTAPGDITTVTVNKIVRRSSSDIEICFSEDLSQVSVTHTEVTVIIPCEDNNTTEVNVGGNAADGSCASFMKFPNISADQRVIFELRLYEGTEGSYVQIRRGSIDFDMPDFTTFRVCEFAHKVGDKKMLRLNCSASGEDFDAILIDDETFTSKDIDGISPPNTTQYILMKNVVEGTELSFQHTVTNVTVNDELMEQSIEVLCNTLPIHDATTNDVPVTKVTMIHKDEDKVDIKDEDKVDILVDTNSGEVLNKLEVLFYEVSDTSLTLPLGTCTINFDKCLVTSLEIDKDVTSFSILLVGLDSSEAVLQSTLLSFEDYKVVVQQLTADSVEVRWTASEKTLYKVTVSPNGGAYSETTVTCGNDESNKCKAYFISISDPETHTVRVQKNEDGEKNIVATDFTMESLATETSQSAKLMLRKLNDKTYLSVCLEKQANATANYTLAIIDQKGTFIDTTGAVTSPCFPELALNTLIMEHLRVLVYAKLDDMEEPLVALDTEVYLFANLSSAYSPLQVIQISARTLKASWVNRNRDNLQYELALNGKTSKVQCKAKAECVKYFHLDSAQEPLIINITEKNKGIVLIATADVPIKDILGKFTR